MTASLEDMSSPAEDEDSSSDESESLEGAKNLLGDDSESSGEEGNDVLGDSDGSESELEIEKKARKLDSKEAEDAILEKKEFLRQAEGDDSQDEDESEDDDEEEEEDDEENEEPAAKKSKKSATASKSGVPQDVTALKQRIADHVQLLSNWKNEKARTHLNRAKRQRDEIKAELTACVATYYGYSDDLANYFMEFFPPVEAIEFFEANETPRPMTIRTNTLKITRQNLAQALIARSCNVDSVEKTKVGLKVYDSKVPVGATPEYLSGRYMIQSASSFIPVMALCPQPDETICDMAAAPGGKTTHIAQLMKNRGVLFANDIRADRCQSLMANVQRMGVQNCVVTNYDGLKLKEVVPKCDRVLLDAPCSGSGIIARDPSIKVKRGLKDFEEHAKLQKELLMTAVDMVDAASKTGGFVVYSTCSVAVEENECVVDHILKVRNVKLVPFDTSVEFGKEGFTRFRDKRFHPSLKHTKRFFPHVHNMDGFFVAKLQKIDNEIPKRIKKDRIRDGPVEWGEEKWTATLQDSVLTFPEIVDPQPVAKESKKAKKRRITEMLAENKKRKLEKEKEVIDFEIEKEEEVEDKKDELAVPVTDEEKANKEKAKKEKGKDKKKKKDDEEKMVEQKTDDSKAAPEPKKKEKKASSSLALTEDQSVQKPALVTSAQEKESKEQVQETNAKGTDNNEEAAKGEGRESTKEKKKAKLEKKKKKNEPKPELPEGTKPTTGLKKLVVSKNDKRKRWAEKMRLRLELEMGLRTADGGPESAVSTAPTTDAATITKPEKTAAQPAPTPSVSAKTSAAPESAKQGLAKPASAIEAARDQEAEAASAAPEKVPSPGVTDSAPLVQPMKKKKNRNKNKKKKNQTEEAATIAEPTLEVLPAAAPVAASDGVKKKKKKKKKENKKKQDAGNKLT